MCDILPRFYAYLMVDLILLKMLQSDIIKKKEEVKSNARIYYWEAFHVTSPTQSCAIMYGRHHTKFSQ